MQITFSYPSGRRVAALVLAVGPDFIRVVTPRRNDGFDICLRDDEWVTETGKTVRVDTILLSEGAVVPWVISAGRRHSVPKKVALAASGGPGV